MRQELLEVKHEDRANYDWMHEMLYEIMLHTKAYSEAEWRSAEPWELPTAALLAPGANRTYGLRLRLAQSAAVRWNDRSGPHSGPSRKAATALTPHLGRQGPRRRREECGRGEGGARGEGVRRRRRLRGRVDG